MKNFKVTVKKANEVETMNTQAKDKDAAGQYVLDKFYYDGWHLVTVEEIE